MDSDNIPLAERLRPSDIDDFIGQHHITGDNSIVRTVISKKSPVSLLFYGPPGSGKTTLAGIIASVFTMPVLEINGVSFSTTVFKKIINETKGNSICIIIDEIHRMNKAQQDALLPFVENGTIYVIGTTTENPSFEINKALLSRMSVIVFEKLTYDDLSELIDRACTATGFSMDNEMKKAVIEYSNYDARQALNILENAAKSGNVRTIDELRSMLSRKFLPYDKSGEEHYNLISALHKSVRGSDVNASLYYLARMLEAGEDPLFIGRRLIRIASEDIGNADPHALGLAIDAYRTYEILGTPEGELALAQCAIYLALAPKSIAVYRAFGAARKSASRYSHLNVPLKLRNAPTDMMKDMGYGKQYRYPPDYPGSFVSEKYFPDSMDEEEYYKPVERGFEREMLKRIAYFRQLREKKDNSNG